MPAMKVPLTVIRRLAAPFDAGPAAGAGRAAVALNGERSVARR